MLLNRNELQDVASEAHEEARLFSLPEGWQTGRELVEYMTWDDPTTDDRDDAHLVERTDDGWKVHVSISEVSSFIPHDSALARYALLMGETRYLPDGTNDPMLPHEISEGRLSLLDTQETPALTLHLNLNEQMEVNDLSFTHDRIRPRRITYPEVNAIAAGHGTPEDIAMVQTHHIFAKRLLQARRNQGAFVFYDNEGTQPSGDRTYRTRRVGELVVQECMILANTQKATFADENNIPILFRNHHLRSGATLDDLRRLATMQLEDAIGEVGNVFDRARYGTTPTGHVGMAQQWYMHGTSPLRRKSDYVSQANINAFLQGKPPVYSTKELDEIGEHLNEVHDRNRRRYYEEGRRAVLIQKLGSSATELQGLRRDARLKLLSAINDVEQLPEGIRTMIREMGTNGELNSEFMKLLVFSKHNGREGWEDVQQAILDQLAQTPYRASHMLRRSIDENLVKQPVHPKIDYHSGGTARCTTHIIAPDGTPYTMTGIAQNRKAATRHAAALLVGRLAGIPPRRVNQAIAA